MIIQLILENFRSFYDRVTCSFTHNLTPATTVLISGASESGKSNLINGMIWLKQFIIGDLPPKATPIPLVPFYNNHENPSYIELIFEKESARYRYGIKLTNQAIISEWLYQQTSQKEDLIFQRDGLSITTGPLFKNTKFLKCVQKLNPDNLFLVHLNIVKEPLSKAVYEFFKKDLFLLKQGVEYIPTKPLLIDQFNGKYPQKTTIKEVITFCQYFSPDCLEIFIDKEVATNSMRGEIYDLLPEFFKHEFQEQFFYILKVRFAPKKHPIILDFDQCSTTFKQILNSALFLLESLIAKDRVIIMEEIEDRLSPLFMTELIKRFTDKDLNQNQAQIMITHRSSFPIDPPCTRQVTKNSHGHSKVFF